MIIGKINNGVHLIGSHWKSGDGAHSGGFTATQGRLADIPMLIKALRVRDREVRRKAHETLCQLAGRDLGRTPESWTRWWAQEGDKRRGEQVHKNAIGRRFRRLKSDLMAGDADAVILNLSDRPRARAGYDGIMVWLRTRKRDLRSAYRDAHVKEINVRGNNATLEVSWGRVGFTLKRFDLERVGGEWKFAVLPWGEKLVRMNRPKVRQNPSAGPVRMPRSKVSGSGLVVFGVVACIALVAIGRLAPHSDIGAMSTALGVLFGLATVVSGLMFWGGRVRRQRLIEARKEQ